MDRVDRIVVVATRQLGDVLLTTPLIRAARVRWPAARIDVLGFAGTLGLLRGNPDIDGRVELPTTGGVRATAALLRRLWRRYDLAFVTQESDRAHLFGWMMAPLRAGLVSPRLRISWWKRGLLRYAVTVAGDHGRVHVAAEKVALVAPWAGTARDAPGDRRADATGSSAAAVACRVVPPPGAALPRDVERQLRDGFVVVQVPSMWRYKQWPLAHFQQLVAGLLADGRQVVLTGSAAPGDRAKVAAMQGVGEAPRLLDVAGRLDLNQLAAVLARAALYIGPDSSVTHLAAALGIPVLALFGPTNPMRWGPLPGAIGDAPYTLRSTTPQRADGVVLLQGTPACVPCGRAGCDDHRDSRSDCLDSIAPGRVIAVARRSLAEREVAAATLSGPAGAAPPRRPAPARPR